MNRLVALLATGVSALGSAAIGCGEPFAYVGGGGAAGASSTTTSDGSSSSSGTGGTSSSSASSSSSGTGGAPECVAGAPGACGSGKYCASDTGTCEACSDFSRLRFGTPVAIPMSPAITNTHVMFGRVSPHDGSLIFSYADKSGSIPRRRIAFAPFVSASALWGSWSLAPAPINSMEEDEAPLFLESGAMLGGLVEAKVDPQKPVVLFDSTRAGVGTDKLFAANPGAAEASPVLLPAGKRDSELAAAPGAVPPRFYWMSDANGATVQHLVTATSGSLATGVKLEFENGCTSDLVQGPWVTPNGRLLLFGAAPPSNTTCTPSLVLKRIYVARMTDKGEQQGGDKARPLFPDDAVSYDSTPSLSPDACFLVFTRFDPFGALMIAKRN